MAQIYAFIRPYPGRLGASIRQAVEAEGFVLGHNMVCPEGMADEAVARLVQRMHVDLLVVPFHVHRGDQGQVLDGVGMLLALPKDVSLNGVSVFMPVRAFSWGASFQRRVDLLKAHRPDLATRLIVAHQEELGTATLSARLRRAAHGGVARAALEESAERTASKSAHPAEERASLSAFSVVPAVPTTHPPSSKKITLPPPPRPLVFSERAADLLRPEGGDPADSAASERLAAPSSGTWRTAGAESRPPQSLVLPVLPSDLNPPLSARESFRRAAEIGARARRKGKPDSARPPKKKP